MTPSYTLGLFFILLVALIWSFASVLIKYVYNDLEFDSPFLLTYICTSLFVVLLPSRIIWQCVSNARTVPWISGPVPTHQGNKMEEFSFLGNDTASGITKTNSFHLDAGMLNNDDSDDNDDDDQRNFILGHYETIVIAVKIAPLWFISNYLYNVSLDYTSISSSTILASTGSLLTYTFSVLAKDEKLTMWKVVGVLLCVAGSLITALEDGKQEDGSKHDTFWGDVAAIASAVGYAAYTIVIRTRCPKNEEHISMQILFGYIGLLNMTMLFPVVAYMFISNYMQRHGHHDDHESVSIPPPLIGWTVLAWLTLKGLLDNVLSDYLWARSVILTNATVATVGLGITVPLALLGDWWTEKLFPSLGNLVGALSFFIGFTLVNLDW